MKFWKAIIAVILIGQIAFNSSAQKKSVAKKNQVISDRKYWLSEMDKMVRPILRSLAADSLRINMPQVTSIHVDNKAHRVEVQYLEVLGRVLSGIAPWIQLEGGDQKEIELRNLYRKWVVSGMKNALDSNAKDFMRFDLGGQQLVDASFLAVAVIRAPWIYQNLAKADQEKLLKSIKITRKFKPVFSNWLLFSAMNEVFLAKNGLDWDPMRVDYALQQMEQWYIGDGMYMDGPSYAYDYYNSFVIHPYLAGIASVIEKKTTAYNGMFEKIKKRNERYAVIQERLINTDGTYPATGRSLIYRGAAFHHLADIALRKSLPKELSPAQVRCALTAVLKKTLESSSTYSKGWLTLGLYGSQPNIGDFYNNQGSPYLATAIFLPLGLSDKDPFWADPPQKWSSQKIWEGLDFPNDHAAGLK
jgi:hypothetical protein